MQSAPNYAMMADVDVRYRAASGFQSRADYSIFYGPLRQSRLLVMNANPGGTPENYSIVDVMRGEHEYIEGRNSGATTRNGAEIFKHVVGCDDFEGIREVQVLNRFFRRSRQRPKLREEQTYMAEARPFLEELIRYIQPEAILFGGDSGVALFAGAHGGKAVPGETVHGPNGSNEAVYYKEYELALPYYRSIPAYGIYHPSKLNGVFRSKVFPLLRDRLGPLTMELA